MLFVSHIFFIKTGLSEKLNKKVKNVELQFPLVSVVLFLVQHTVQLVSNGASTIISILAPY